ncbi:MAG: LUD domain-containing protein [Flavobacteriaceae bacterium]
MEENSSIVKMPKALLFISNKFFKKTVGQKMTLLDKTAFYVLFFKIDENLPNPKALVIHCEYLIANKGAILICNRQIQEKKLSDLPQNLIIIATSNDFKNDVSEAMAEINQKYKSNLPSNITTLNAFDPTKENDFLSYGGNAKHLYLLVQEVNE